MTVTRCTPVAELPEMLSVEEVACYLDIGKSLAYALIACRELPSVRLGRLVRVPRVALAALLAGKPSGTTG
jgi:excisionase family DNA binding protein